MNNLVIGILAHVDAGKTTLSEALLYNSGKIKQLGRVDHKNAYLDYEGQERNRGITIYSKQAVFQWKDTQFFLLDTPGHADFSSEMERTLQVLDVAVLVVSGSEGVQVHTKTIWQLLQRYHIPTIVFVNKMDMIQSNKEVVLKSLEQLSSNFVDYSVDEDEQNEAISLLKDELLDNYLETGEIDFNTKNTLFFNQEMYPVVFGSALKNEGVQELLEVISSFKKDNNASDIFSGRVYKITRDENNQRLTHIKILSGKLCVKDVILENQKIDQIRIYSGNKYTMVQEVSSGMVCAVKGLEEIYSGDIIGMGEKKIQPLLTSCMDYRIILPDGVDAHQVYPLFKQLAEEDPTLHLFYDTKAGEIRVRLMGKIQIEVLRQMILERFNLNVDFGYGKILYKETIKEKTLGVGHYEPLRHYAEVHLIIEPGKVGSGIQIETDCSVDLLGRHYQNLILSHIKEKEHLGVLTGSPLTDVKITLVNGKAHLKHTEGGDFRQATYRAIRQGLTMTESVLLEPYFKYDAVIPTESLSRFIFNMDEMQGTYHIDRTDEVMTYISGEAPVATMQDYNQELIAYTKGQGKINYQLSGYYPCHNQQEVVELIGYDQASDLENPSSSVFCSHGAGFVVPSHEVYDYMHLETNFFNKEEDAKYTNVVARQMKSNYSDDDLMKVFESTYGKVERKTVDQFGYRKKEVKKDQQVSIKPECILVDGYNLIFAWDELAQLANDNLDVARSRLIDYLTNYQGFKKCLLILVFDAYKVKENLGKIEKYHNIYIVYTKEAQTADMFIERTTHQMSNEYQISVVTSDALEQIIVMAKGARRISSREFVKEVEYLTTSKMKEYIRNKDVMHEFPLEQLKYDYYKEENNE